MHEKIEQEREHVLDPAQVFQQLILQNEIQEAEEYHKEEEEQLKDVPSPMKEMLESKFFIQDGHVVGVKSDINPLLA